MGIWIQSSHKKTPLVYPAVMQVPPVLKPHAEGGRWTRSQLTILQIFPMLPSERVSTKNQECFQKVKGLQKL